MRRVPMRCASCRRSPSRARRSMPWCVFWTGCSRWRRLRRGRGEGWSPPFIRRSGIPACAPFCHRRGHRMSGNASVDSRAGEPIALTPVKERKEGTMNAPRFAARSVGKLMIAFAVAAALGAVAANPARADGDDHWHHGWHDHDRGHHWGWYYPRPYYGYYAPPVVVAPPPPPVVYAPPPPPVVYAPPPPVVYSPPSLNVIVPLHFR